MEELNECIWRCVVSVIVVLASTWLIQWLG